jgi:hypothetical protein
MSRPHLGALALACLPVAPFRGSVPWTPALWLYPRGSDGALGPVPPVALTSPAP